MAMKNEKVSHLGNAQLNRWMFHRRTHGTYGDGCGGDGDDVDVRAAAAGRRRKGTLVLIVIYLHFAGSGQVSFAGNRLTRGCCRF